VGSLLLIRHGQASFAADEYDVLSALGEAQARRLGAHLAGGRLDAIYAGPRRRQLDTARIARAAAAEAGARWPEIVVLEELDEFPFQEVLRIGLQDAREADRSAPIIEPRGGFSRAFHRVMRAWIDGRIAGDFERWADFVARVERGIDRVVAAEESADIAGRRAAVVTSGGPIAVAMRRALELSDEATLRMQAVVANTSVSELKRRRGEPAGALTLIGFNAVHHLASSEVTYR
jgi:broad specificity phosphatase PhoE